MATDGNVDTVDIDEVESDDILGSAIERREDPALLTGDAEYTDDIERPNMAHLAMVRSQYGHAEVNDIDTSAAEAHDDILAVYTAEDLEAAGVPGELPVAWLLPSLNTPPYPILARDRVRYQGQPIAVVVAEERYAARDAIDLVDIDYGRLDAVADAREAVERDDAPTLHEEAENNVAFDWEIGDPDGIAEAVESADHVVELEFENQKLMPTAMEPRACVAEYNPSTEKLELHMTTQNPHVHRLLISGVLGVSENKLRIVAPDVGGGFGSKIHHYPDEALTSFAAQQLERPIKWQATRSEGFMSTAHGRGHQTKGKMALTDDGDILGVEFDTYADVGGYLSTFGSAIPTWMHGTMNLGQYMIPNYYCNVTGVFTNTTPVDAYRGAGRPEASYAIERMVTHAARELDMDPTELRRQNFIPKEEFPYTAPSMVTYDSGDYEKPLDKALEAVGYEEFRDRQDHLRDEGRYLGIGFSCYVEACGIAPSELAGQLGAQAGLWESGVVRMHNTGKVTVLVGTSGHGQGHETTFAQVVADKLGVPYEDVEIVEGDTDEIPEGTGTYGSRSAAVGGSAIVQSAEKVIEKARTIAAHQLEAPEEDIEFEDGVFQVAGAPDRSMAIQEVAQQAYLAHDMPDGIEPGLEETSFYDPDNFTFPFGVHVAIVEVDPGSGEIEFQRYVAVDDCGEQINPKIVEGQIHGGIAQGIGQAMYENVEYDSNGTLMTGSLQDYAVPKAEHIPEMETYETVTPSPHNPLGVKGVGEAGTIAAPQAVVNAVTDALQPFGVDHIDMPLSEEAVWTAIQEAQEE